MAAAMEFEPLVQQETVGAARPRASRRVFMAFAAGAAAGVVAATACSGKAASAEEKFAGTVLDRQLLVNSTDANGTNEMEEKFAGTTVVSTFVGSTTLLDRQFLVNSTDANGTNEMEAGDRTVSKAKFIDDIIVGIGKGVVGIAENTIDTIGGVGSGIGTFFQGDVKGGLAGVSGALGKGVIGAADTVVQTGVDVADGVTNGAVSSLIEPLVKPKQVMRGTGYACALWKDRHIKGEQYNLHSLYTKDYRECNRVCAGRSDCKSWNWVHRKKGECYLKKITIERARGKGAWADRGKRDGDRYAGNVCKVR